MKRYKAVIEYKGTNYAGWQIQNNALTIQEILQDILTVTLKEKIKLTASGRTDSGVHAKGQVVHFDSATTIPAGKIPFAINNKLPKDIAMLRCEVVENDFNARYGAKQKTYSYSFYISKHKRPLLEETKVKLSSLPNIDKLNEVARLLEGEHDFKAFMAAKSAVKTTIRTIFSIKIVPNQDILTMYITGNGFLYNMVRIIIGTMIDYANGKLTKLDIYDILESGEREKAGKTFSAKGLCLEEVKYL